MSTKFHSSLLFATLCLLPVLGLAAEEGRMDGPVSGFVFDRTSGSIRPMLGFAGSAYLGPAAAQGYDLASVSPTGRAALATREGHLYLLTGLDKQNPAVTPMEETIPGVERFAWNEDGLSAVVFSAASRQLQILRDLDKTPAIEAAIDLSALDGAVSALVFDGRRILIGTYFGDTGGIYLLPDRGAPKLLARMAKPVGIALANRNRDLFVVDRDLQQIWSIQDYAGAATPMLFADERSGLSKPVGIALTKDGRRLLVANSGARNIDALEIDSRNSAGRIELDFTPTRMEAFGQNALALLNAGETEPLYVIDRGERLGVYFVPAGREQ